MFRLLQCDFMNDYKTVSNANKKLRSLYRWKYDDARIDYALNSLVDEGLLDNLKEDKQPNKFRKTRSVPKQVWLIPDRIITELEEMTGQRSQDSLTPAHHQMAGMLYALRHGEKMGKALFRTVLYSYSPKNIERSLNVLKSLELVKRTEDQVNSSKQMYRLTEKGRELLRKVGVEVTG